MGDVSPNESLTSNGEPAVTSGPSPCLQLRVDAPAPAGNLSGHLALVTGGGSGIGQAIARQMVAAGAEVVVLGRSEDRLAATVDQLGNRCSCVVHDLCQLDDAEPLIDRLINSRGIPSILVNNAGEHLKRDALDTGPADFARIMRTHVDGAFAISNAVARAMLHSDRKDRSILFISSMASLIGIPGVAAYAAAKTAQLGLVRTLAMEWSPHGIRVNSIAPGWIDTSMSRAAFSCDGNRLRKVLDRTPLGRLGMVEEVARAATFLCSSDASFITGAVLPVDGGASIGF